MTEYYARHNSNIYFATMHPGWSDTPGLKLIKLQFFILLF